VPFLNPTGQDRPEARADRAPAHQIRVVLGRDHVEKFVAGRKAQLVELHQELARQAQSLVDVEAAVEIRVVDQPFPPDGGARLLEIDAHDDHEVLFELRLRFQQAPPVLQPRLGIVNRAGTDDHQQPVVRPVQDAMNSLARLESQLFGLLRGRKLAQQMSGGSELLDLADSNVVNPVMHDYSCAVPSKKNRQAVSLAVSRWAVMRVATSSKSPPPAGESRRSKIGRRTRGSYWISLPSIQA
jgi:hypothetical protein